MKYIIIALTGVAVSVLTKIGALLGLLDLDASTAGFLVAVIALGVEVGHDVRARLDRHDFLASVVARNKPYNSEL